MNEEEYEYKWFWEVEDGIYDLDGDLLIWSLMGVAVVSLQESIYSHYAFIPFINHKVIEKRLK